MFHYFGVKRPEKVRWGVYYFFSFLFYIKFVHEAARIAPDCLHHASELVAHFGSRLPAERIYLSGSKFSSDETNVITGPVVMQGRNTKPANWKDAVQGFLGFQYRRLNKK